MVMLRLNSSRRVRGHKLPLFFPLCAYAKSLPMAILKVTRLGHPVLRKVTENISVKELKTAAIQRFIDDMVETMKEYDGVGLAADQVFTSKQLAVLEVSDNPRYPNKGKVPLTVLVNPKITPLSDEIAEDWETRAYHGLRNILSAHPCR